MKRKAGPLSPVKVVLLLCGAEVLSMTGFATYPALLPLFRHEWGLSASEAGLISGVFFAGYMVATPILVGLTDRLDTRRIYLVATLLAALGSVGFAFFAFSIGLSGSSGGVLLGAAALAAWINLLGPAASILGNEAAIHRGRRRVIALTMAGSGLLACLVGFSAPLPLMMVFTITAIYFLLIMGDSAALTAGLVASVPDFSLP